LNQTPSSPRAGVAAEQKNETQNDPPTTSVKPSEPRKKRNRQDGNTKISPEGCVSIYDSAVLTLTLIILGIYTKCVAQQTDLLERSLSAQQDYSISTLRAANAMQKTAKRAYVTAGIGFNPQIPGTGYTIGQPNSPQLVATIVLADSGPTPARDVTLTASAEVAPYRADPNFGSERVIWAATKKKTLTNFGQVFARTPFVRSGNQRPIGPIRQSVIDSLLSMNTKIIVHGAVTYKDAFGDCHWYLFCQTYGVPNSTGEPTGWLACDEHNDNGDGCQPPK
jgi:hypothetical protein